jgi:hypothetical protein
MFHMPTEVTAAIAGAVVTTVGAAVAAWVLALNWAVQQKRKELAIEAGHDLSRAYGEFFAVWKLWNYAFADAANERSPAKARWMLLERAAASEAQFEALLVRLATERALSAREREFAGRFRQGYQQLRQAIKDNRKLDWSRSDKEQYRAFKVLACEMTELVRTADGTSPPSSKEACEALLAITSNDYEPGWWQFEHPTLPQATRLTSIVSSRDGETLPPPPPTGA